MRRLAVLLAVALGLILAFEEPAAAHGSGGIEATNYETTLPIEGARLCVTLAVGGGLGLTTACILVIRRTPAARRVLAEPDDGYDERSDGGGERDDVVDGKGTSAPPAAAPGAGLGVGSRAGPAG